MAAEQNRPTARDLGAIFGQGDLAAGDRSLLDRFVARGDEAAFEALVLRHGPMVHGACRRLLADPNDIDDAFQATFLALILRAASIRDPDRLGPWLYGVALRVAKKARSRRGRHLALLGTIPAPEASDDLAEVRPLLDAELGKLTPKLREVLVLCLLEGATAEEAARRLACPLGTVKSRLARGREALQSRLIARGVAPTVALAATSTTLVLVAPVSAALVRGTLASVTAAKPAPALLSLTRGVAPVMFSRPIVLSSLVLGGFALASLGTVSYLKARAGVLMGPPQAPLPDDALTRRNMQTICLAINNHNDAFDHLPTAAIYGPDGKPKLSWRVSLLPLLDEGSLYGAFKLDEPWDSPHNRKLIARMPAVFRTPGDLAPPGWTYIRTFVGKGALFEPYKEVSFRDVTDGVSNTLAIAVAEQPVEWTRPDELPYAEGEALPSLRRSDPRGWLIGTADAKVRNLQPDNDFLRRIITRAGGEAITWPPVTVRQVLPTPPPTPRHAEDGAARSSPDRGRAVGFGRDDPAPKADAPPGIITFAEVRPRSVTITRSYACQLAAHHHIEVRTPVSGSLEEILVRAGQDVKRGDLLFRVRPLAGLAGPDAKRGGESVPNAAPYDGLIGRLLRQQGSFVREGESVTSLSDVSVMWAYFHVAESQYLEFMAVEKDGRREARIELQLANGTRYSQPGKLGAIEAEFDSRTGTIAFRADFPNPDRLLRHGQAGTLMISREEKDAIAIPQRATIVENGKRYVYVVGGDDLAHRREIVVRAEIDDLFVLRRGLEAGEMIADQGAARLDDGDKVINRVEPGPAR